MLRKIRRALADRELEKLARLLAPHDAFPQQLLRAPQGRADRSTWRKIVALASKAAADQRHRLDTPSGSPRAPLAALAVRTPRARRLSRLEMTLEAVRHPVGDLVQQHGLLFQGPFLIVRRSALRGGDVLAVSPAPLVSGFGANRTEADLNRKLPLPGVSQP